MLRKIVITSAVAVLALTGCSSDDTADPTTTTTTEATTTTVEPATTSTTPTPSADQSQALVVAIAAVYPGVDADDTIDNVRNICQEILTGKDDATLVRNAGMRFAGGDRPDPTEAQAQAIVEAVRTSGFCA